MIALKKEEINPLIQYFTPVFFKKKSTILYAGKIANEIYFIEHPEGIVVVDTGENSQILQLDQYLSNESGWMRYQFKHAAKFEINHNQELDFQLAALNIAVSDIQLIVLTHLHLDHTDGLKYFYGKDIVIGNEEFKHAKNHMPSTYPKWFKPHQINYLNNKVEVFEKAFSLTQSNDLLYIPTPGHTRGHSSVLFRADDVDILFAGDTSYSQEQLINFELAGVNSNYKQSLFTYQKIMDYSKTRKLIYLPTHDPMAGERLKNFQYIGNNISTL